MKKIMKRAAAALLSLTMLGGGIPFAADTFSMPDTALTAQAIDPTEIDPNSLYATIEFDPGNGTGTMKSGSIFIGYPDTGNYVLPKCTFTAPYNMNFSSWEFNGKSYQPGEVIEVRKGVNKITVTYALSIAMFEFRNCGTLGYQQSSGRYTFPYPSELNLPTYENEEFVGYRWETTGMFFLPGQVFPPHGWLENESIPYGGNWFYFYGVWVEPKNVTLKFNAGDGGTGTMNDLPIGGSTTFTVPECTFTPPKGKKFECWSVKGIGYKGDMYHLPGDVLPAETSVFNLTANWVDVAPTEDVQISHNVALNNNFSIAYYIPTATFQDCTDVRLSVKKEVYTDEGVTYKETVLTDPVVEDSGYGEEFVFIYRDIAAKEIGSNVTAVIEADMDGTTYYSEPDVYSVKQYATNKLSKSSDANLKKLLVDMLNYGAAAQTYFNYNTVNLANNKLTIAQRKLATDPSTLNIISDASETKISSPKAQFTGKNLLLGNNVAIVYYMTFDNSLKTNNVNLKLTYTTVKGETLTKTVPFSKFINGDYANEYRFDFTEIQAKDSCQPVTAVLYEGSKQISNIITYSVQTYAYNKLNKSTTSTELKSIINALMVYCKSAKNYFSA